MAVLELLAPIFVLIALGAGLFRLGLLGPELNAGINRLLYWVGLPVVVFHALAVAPQSRLDALGPLLAVLLLATAASVGVAWLWSSALRVPRSGRGTFIQAAFRGNLSFVGLPLLLSVPGVPAGPAVLVMAPMLVAYNVVAVVVLVRSQQTTGAGAGWPLFREVLRNPIILASVAGAAWHFLGWPLPRWSDLCLAAVAQMALPLALLCIGGGLMSVPLAGVRWTALVAAVHKVGVSPLLGYAVGRAFGLPAPELLVVLLCLTCPTAAVSYTMVRQLGGDQGLAAGATVASAVLSAPALVCVLAWFAPL